MSVWAPRKATCCSSWQTKNKVVFDSLGALRNHLAKMLHLYEEGTFDFLWVTDFPLFEYDEEEGRWVAMHHPFTSPKLSDVDKLLSDPGHTYARAYDIVLNGCRAGRRFHPDQRPRDPAEDVRSHRPHR